MNRPLDPVTSRDALAPVLRDVRAVVSAGTVRLVRALYRASIPTAAASASRHAGELLTRAGVLDLFDALVDGGEAARLGLAGKPRPDLFRHRREPCGWRGQRGEAAAARR